MVCIDASLAIAAILSNDPNHVAAVNLLQSMAEGNVVLCAPALFAYECDSVIRLNIYRGSITNTEGIQASAMINALGVVLEFDDNDRTRTLEIATLYGQARAYDAAYAAYAEARGIDLYTTDKPFFQALNGKDRPAAQPALTFIKLLQ